MENTKASIRKKIFLPFYIAIEGMENAGKTSLKKRLSEDIRIKRAALGRKTLFIREPNDLEYRDFIILNQRYLDDFKKHLKFTSQGFDKDLETAKKLIDERIDLFVMDRDKQFMRINERRDIEDIILISDRSVISNLAYQTYEINEINEYLGRILFDQDINSYVDERVMGYTGVKITDNYLPSLVINLSVSESLYNERERLRTKNNKGEMVNGDYNPKQPYISNYINNICHHMSDDVKILYYHDMDVNDDIEYEKLLDEILCHIEILKNNI